MAPLDTTCCLSSNNDGQKWCDCIPVFAVRVCVCVCVIYKNQKQLHTVLSNQSVAQNISAVVRTFVLSERSAGEQWKVKYNISFH